MDVAASAAAPLDGADRHLRFRVESAAEQRRARDESPAEGAVAREEIGEADAEDVPEHEEIHPVAESIELSEVAARPVVQARADDHVGVRAGVEQSRHDRRVDLRDIALEHRRPVQQRQIRHHRMRAHDPDRLLQVRKRLQVVAFLLAQSPSRIKEATEQLGVLRLAGAQADQTTWEEMMQRRLFKPLDMKTASAVYPGDGKADCAAPHKRTGPRIAVIYAVGLISTGRSSDAPQGDVVGSDTIVEYLRKARSDKSVRAVVLRIDSPGGSAIASDVIWREVMLTRDAKPVIASMSDVAASGGYYIAMPAHARAAVVSMEARYKKLHAAGKEQEANEFRLVDPTDTSNTTSVQFFNRQSYLNPCLDSSQRFVDKVIGEIAQMHKEAGQPIKTWHFGGDEAKNIRLGAGYTDKAKPEPGKGIIDQSNEDKPWAKSQVCQVMIKEGKVADMEHLPSYFGQEVSKLVKAHGIDRMQAWQDGLKDAESSKAFATSRPAMRAKPATLPSAGVLCRTSGRMLRAWRPDSAKLPGSTR